MERKILLERRIDNSLWGIPGGVIEYGENIKDAVKREVKEETGLDTTIDHFVGIYTNPTHMIEFSDGEVRQEFSVLFACRIIGGDMQISKDSLQFAFFTEDEIRQLDMTASIRQRLDNYTAKHDIPIIH